MAASAEEAAALMKTLSNPGRLMILCLLVEGEKSVAELEQHLRTKQPNVSQQLARMRLEGHVQARRDGRHIFYSLADDRVREIITALHGAFCPTPKG
ncbi:MAG: helix-turn-helix transcriptional regulator [Rhodobacteraceae bacterium]|nr:helix-turn-helix transcriptional regulator [Paracoccaceae bacterium]